MSLGVYIQVPFCQTKCTYCNFHTGVVSASVYEPYVDAVCREIRDHETLLKAAGIDCGTRIGASFSWPGLENRGDRKKGDLKIAPACVDTIYVGGGTPSLLAPSSLARILEVVRDSFDGAVQEVTLEADPETITPEKAAAWREAGFNRISLGCQSFHDNELKAAGRMHRRADIYSATRVLREAGFANFSFDLICGLPHQTAESWERSLAQLLELRPEHVSIYLLEVDEGSRLGREVISLGTRYSAPAVPSDDDMAAFYDRACERLADVGYEHYEISNWALPGRRSRHNLKYWQREPYLGFGAGAHSFHGRERWANAHDPAAYVAAIAQGRLPVEQHERLTAQQELDEELFLGLRLLDGIDAARIEKQYDVSLLPRLAALRDAGLLELDGSKARLAPSRLAISNEVFVELID